MDEVGIRVIPKLATEAKQAMKMPMAKISAKIRAKRRIFW